ncbi:hypothetical protein [Kitasatospora sp. CB01950]|uniref:hypothetical protein n=1 Tax=Kitasatospora sp. CB01950 TaxID=1703930 RepID=UPI00093E26C0|nr:hypothetical protein [Kitasatospora sp. CB01950]OKJ02861.1 hypothetical protein AMK19_27360 [Kitasatospora sp. CB01950]
MTGIHATRALRGAVFTALAVPLAAFGQVVITGRALPLTLVAVACVAVFLLAVLLDGARRRFLLLAAVLVPVELLLNTAFNLGQDACSRPVHGVDLLVCGGDRVSGSELFAQWTHNSAGMLRLLVLGVHLALALAAAAWLRLADAALDGVAEAVRTAARILPCCWRSLLLATRPACPAALLPRAGVEPAPRRPQDAVHSPAPRRGPPQPAFAC